MTSRKLSVAGSFYPNSFDSIQKMIAQFNQILKSAKLNDEFYQHKPKALIVPHAGYVYSGFTANSVYQMLNDRFERVVVIGPSHRVGFNGSSIALYDNYEIPSNNSISIDKEYSNYLQQKFNLNFYEQVHHEHSTEVQIPFIKHYLSKTKVVEIIYGKEDYQNISNIINEVMQDETNLIVISTDLSHFYTQKDAQQKDNICIEAIKNLDIKEFDNGCEACGILGVKAIINSSKQLKLNPTIIDYRTSAEYNLDPSSVVGYLSVVFE